MLAYPGKLAGADTHKCARSHFHTLMQKNHRHNEVNIPNNSYWTKCGHIRYTECVSHTQFVMHKFNCRIVTDSDVEIMLFIKKTAKVDQILVRKINVRSLIKLNK